MDPLKSAAAAPLTESQTAALKKLHAAAQQLEGVFVSMMFKEMHKSAATTSIFGKVSEAEKTFSEMLDDKRSESISKTGSLGLAKIIENQLRASVVGTTAPNPSSAVAPIVPPNAPATGKQK